MFERIRFRLAGAIRTRFARDEKFGLHVTIGAVLTFLFMWLFYSVMEDLADREVLFRSDYSIHMIFAAHRTPFLTKLAVFFTTLGNFSTVTLGMICLSAYLFVLRRWYQLSALIVSVAGGALALAVLKLIIHRPRPPIYDALTITHTFSFPSGHSFVAFSFYAALAWILHREGKSILIKTLPVILGIMVILGIGLSRIYLGVHWPSDVLGGYAAGAAWFTVLATALETWSDIDRPPMLGRKGRRILAICLILIWICGAAYSMYTFPFRTDQRGGYESPVTFVRMEYIQSRQVA